MRQREKSEQQGNIGTTVIEQQIKEKKESEMKFKHKIGTSLLPESGPRVLPSGSLGERSNVN